MTKTIEETIEQIVSSLDAATLAEFRNPERWNLREQMKRCGMTEYPAVSGDPNGFRCSGEMICEKCGQDYYTHPIDWRVIEYGNVPFLNVLCDGQRVKL